MTPNLWSLNHPRSFWQCQPDVSDELWETAITRALPSLGLVCAQPDIDSILALTLGEGRFGPAHWSLGFPKRTYYFLKPILPRKLTRVLRQQYGRPAKVCSDVQWPIEPRYAAFLWDTMAQLLKLVPDQQLSFKPLWPDGFEYALVLTHDVESSHGQAFVRDVADLEESLGLRSSFNFVPERYPLDMHLMAELRQRGFEVGVHGLRHDGKLFDSRSGFMQRAKSINGYLQAWNAKGFRAELMHRQPEWMQALDIEYDLSFFDTDPFEPIPGGTMSIWPFFMGHFVELPYTLVQDYTLTSILSETSPRIWLEKVDFIRKYHGLALLNTHPDYLRNPANLDVYRKFLGAMKNRAGYWHALPHDVARWWKRRSTTISGMDLQGVPLDTARLQGGKVEIEPQDRAIRLSVLESS